MPVLTNFMFCLYIYVIVGFKNFTWLMLFVKCKHMPTLDKIYLLA